VDEAGNCLDVESSDVNEYLKEITGRDITAPTICRKCYVHPEVISSI